MVYGRSKGQCECDCSSSGFDDLLSVADLGFLHSNFLLNDALHCCGITDEFV